MYISRLIIYICLDICDYLYLTGVCVACLTGATCCCVLSKVIESQYIYINIYMGRKIYKSIFYRPQGLLERLLSCGLATFFGESSDLVVLL